MSCNLLQSTSCYLLWAVIIFTTSALAEDGTIKLEVEANEVYVGDTINITVESIGLVDPLDTSILSDSARYERETYGTRIFVQSGKVVDVKIRRMEFTATKTGPVIFGPVTSGDISSNSVSVNVLDAVRSEWIPEQRDLTIDVGISNPNPYVHSQLIVDITLEHQYVIAEESIVLPEFNGFIVRTVYEARRTFTDDTQLRRQIQWRYLLFAERSGKLEINPVLWEGTTIKSRPERAKFTRESNPVSVSIAPSVSENGTTEWWLPTSFLEMTESWSSELTTLKAGDEITRKIVVTAGDVLASQIPAPTVLESRALSQILINESRKEIVTPKGVKASAEFTYRLNAKSPIPVFLDTVRIPWWNTASDTAQQAIIPARRINVGLPDRADLLKKIAQESTGTSALKLWWADADLLRLVMYGLGALLFVPVLTYICNRLMDRSLRSFRNAGLKKKLRQLTQEQAWEQLGTEIQSSKQADTSESSALILQIIFPVLYGKTGATIDSQSVLRLIDSINLEPNVYNDDPGKLVKL